MFDDVVTIELQAIAGVTIPLVDSELHGRRRRDASAVSSNLTPGTDRYQATFPYLGTPHDGFDTPPGS